MTLTVVLKDRQMQGVLTGCVLMAALAWSATLSFAPGLEGLTCGEVGLGFAAAAGGSHRVFSLIAMWFCMMIAMVLPVAALGLLRGDAVSAASGRSALAFLCGYLGVVLTLAVGAGVLQWALEISGWLSDDTRDVDPAMRGMLLIAAALYPALQHLGRFRGCSAYGEGRSPSLSSGFSHGCASIGCCLAMIAVQFAVGSMSALWMSALALWMMLEALSPWREKLAAFSAIGLLTAGSLSLVGALL
jgi:predicted metal-binding membrane protein